MHGMTAPLLRACPVPFIGQKAAHGRQQEGAEPALLAVGARNPVLGEQAGKELLRQVLRVRRRVAPAPHVGIEGIPVSAAQLLQRAVGFAAWRGDRRPPRPSNASWRRSRPTQACRMSCVRKSFGYGFHDPTCVGRSGWSGDIAKLRPQIWLDLKAKLSELGHFQSGEGQLA